MTTVLGWLAGSSQTLPVPAKPATALLGALIGLALLWAKWTHALWKLSSKRERIRDALSMGRPICHCSESSEIMTQHHALEHSIDVYACPVCKNFEIVHPKGSVLIAENTEFRPPLPATVRQHWLNQSNQLR
jgi:hypothetical protein